MKRKQSDLPSRIYSYGADRPIAGKAAVDDQYYRAYQYQRTLVEIENRRRREWAEAEKLRGGELGVFAEKIDALGRARGEVREAIRQKRGAAEQAPGKGKRAGKNVDVNVENGVLAAIDKELKETRLARKEARERWELSAEDKEKLTARWDPVLPDHARAKGNPAASITEMVMASPEMADRERLFLLQLAARIRAREAGKAARASCGCGSGTYQLVEQAHGAACSKCKGRLDAGPYEGEGRLGLQFSPGIPFAEVTGAKPRGDELCGKCKAVGCVACEGTGRRKSAATGWLEVGPMPNGRRLPTKRNPEGLPARPEHRLARIRIGAGPDGEPLFAEFPIVYPNRPDARGDRHEVPPDARIKWAWMLRRRVGLKYEYRLQFSLEAESFRPPKDPVGTGRVAIDFGWRNLADGGIRVAYWVDDAGLQGEVRVPSRTQAGLGKVTDLRSIRDKHLDFARAYLLAYLDTLPEVPEWLQTARRRFAKSRSQRKLARLTREWARLIGVPLYQGKAKPPGDTPADTLSHTPPIPAGSAAVAAPIFVANRLDGDEVLVRGLVAWNQKDRHLLAWEAHQRDRRIGHRNDTYRKFAVGLARTYAEVITKSTDFRAFAEAPAPEDGMPSDDRDQRRTARVASPGKLRQDAKRSIEKYGGCYTLLPSPDTTRNHWACGTRLVGNARTDIRLFCPKCQVFEDQDVNSGKNMLRLASGPVTPRDGEALADDNGADGQGDPGGMTDAP